MLGENSKVDSEKKEKTQLVYRVCVAVSAYIWQDITKKWNKWAENIVEPYEVTNSDDITESGGDQDVTLDSESQTKIKAEVINSNEVRQPGDGQSFSLDPQLQTETDVEITNSDNPEGDEVKIGDSRDSGINEDELRYEDDFNIQLLLKQITQGLEEEVAQLEIELEILKEAFSDAAQEVIALREENEQLKHNLAKINELDTRNTTEGTLEQPSTSVTNIEKNSHRANLLQSFSQ